MSRHQQRKGREPSSFGKVQSGIKSSARLREKRDGSLQSLPFATAPWPAAERSTRQKKDGEIITATVKNQKKATKTSNSISQQTQEKTFLSSTTKLSKQRRVVEDSRDNTAIITVANNNSSTGSRSQQQTQQQHNHETIKQRIPNVLIGGVQKGGTMSVTLHLEDFVGQWKSQTQLMKNHDSDSNYQYTCLSRKPLPHLSVHGKEAHFFDNDDAYHNQGLQYYQNQYKHCDFNRSKFIIDATPETMVFPERVKSTYEQQGTTALRELKIMFILREPVSREISWYNHRVKATQRKHPPEYVKSVMNTTTKSILSFEQVMKRTVLASDSDTDDDYYKCCGMSKYGDLLE